MAIPSSILSVKRPSSTVVRQRGKKFIVIKRTSKRKGKRVIPVDLGKVGEIVDGRFVETQSKPRQKKKVIDVKDYGEVALCNEVAHDLLDLLAKIWPFQDAERLFVIALLRASYGEIKNRSLDLRYETSVASEKYPGIHLSEHALSDCLERVGQEYSKIIEFMKVRVGSFTGGNLVIDGMLKDYNAEECALSQFSRKARTKGSKDISIMYAFDPASGEPIAAKAYAGNVLDLTAVTDFVSENEIKNGMLIMDKGFYNENLFRKTEMMENLSYLIPLKNNSTLIKKYSMDNPTDLLSEYKEEVVFYKKEKTSNGYLYSFRIPKMASDQETAYALRFMKGKMDPQKYQEKKSLFGLIVFKTKDDLDPLTVYKAYSQRWSIEVFFNMYKNIIDRDIVNVHGDYRVYATEFINFLTAIISTRVKNLLEEKELTKSYSYKHIFEILSTCKVARRDPTKEFMKCCTTKYATEIVEKLGV